MAQNPSFLKRQKEKARADKRARKEEQKAKRKEERRPGTPLKDGEDPDIAGIVPGPQPLPWADED